MIYRESFNEMTGAQKVRSVARNLEQLIEELPILLLRLEEVTAALDDRLEWREFKFCFKVGTSKVVSFLLCRIMCSTWNPSHQNSTILNLSPCSFNIKGTGGQSAFSILSFDSRIKVDPRPRKTQNIILMSVVIFDVLFSVWYFKQTPLTPLNIERSDHTSMRTCSAGVVYAEYAYPGSTRSGCIE